MKVLIRIKYKILSFEDTGNENLETVKNKQI